MQHPQVNIIGAGLAGSEAALTLADLGVKLRLYEMKPQKKTPAQKLDSVCELVCSNSFRSNQPTSAVGLLKDEMLVLNGKLMPIALETQVPAGDSLAVDRVLFSQKVEERIKQHPLIDFVSSEVLDPFTLDGFTIVATGPLTSDEMAQSLAEFIGEDSLAFYDAIAPIVDTESIDFTKAFYQSRWKEEEKGDYINCPMDKDTYYKFVEKLNTATKTAPHKFEDLKYFEGCLPLEVMAERGPETLRFGPLKPVGLFDPHKNEKPYAVLQLRKEDKHGTAYNMVGCQTRMNIPEQKDAFKLIPALSKVNFLRFGSIHRNTFINSPKVLDKYLRLKDKNQNPTNVFLAGQITGVEGYVESMACGLMVALFVNRLINNQDPKMLSPHTAMGGLYHHILGLNRAFADTYCPSNVNWSMVAPLEWKTKLKRNDKRKKMSDFALLETKKYHEEDKNNRQSLAL